MPPADPPPPAPDPAADVTAAPAGSAPAWRPRAAADSGGRAPSAITAEWTTTREVALECAGCGAGFVLSYKYRFVEGLAAKIVRCPASGCGRGREYYLPVNAFDVLVAAPGGATPPRAV